MKFVGLTTSIVFVQAMAAEGHGGMSRRHLRGKHAIVGDMTKSRHLKKGEDQKWDDTKIYIEEQQMATQYGTPLGSNGLPDCSPPNCYTQLQKDVLKDAADKVKEQAVDRIGGSVGEGGTMEVIDSFDVTTNGKQLHFTVYVVHPADQQGDDKPVEVNRAPLSGEVGADEMTRLPYNEKDESDRPVPGTAHVDLVLDKVVPGLIKKPDIGADSMTLGSPTSGGGLPAPEYNRVQPNASSSAGENNGVVTRCSVPTWNLSGSGSGHECNHDFDCFEGCCAITNQILGSRKCVPPDVNPAFNLICQGDVDNDCVDALPTGWRSIGGD
mmetsp:Transcript_15729/g.45337  ORF Transcript_15729/g.45337 Transcript_15729/m.45337 type:complete len:325 (-) Transcript_15729:74-1048(-)